jgi:hypothetical protein
MREDEANRHLEKAVSVTREDIARAKSYVMRSSEVDTDNLAEQWLSEQSLRTKQKVDGDSPHLADDLTNLARAISVRLALYYAVSELVAVGELFAAGPPGNWQPLMDYSFRHQHGGLSPNIHATFPSKIQRPQPVSTLPSDPDVFLQGANCKNLHSGILAGIEQALDCFRRGMYMPATVMLAASVEGTWTECGIAVASKLGKNKLHDVVTNPFEGIGKKVQEIRKALEQPQGKALLKAAEQPMSKVIDAETWTTVLRDRRNALHWTKSRNFITDHSGTGTLLMGAPLHIDTLEAIRLAAN